MQTKLHHINRNKGDLATIQDYLYTRNDRVSNGTTGAQKDSRLITLSPSRHNLPWQSELVRTSRSPNRFTIRCTIPGAAGLVGVVRVLNQALDLLLEHLPQLNCLIVR